ncbi:hypothetical protein QYF61_002018 [Mycteria americana]|uniref:Uncharacterized protein n=1 Tax=Mycteria americana TaxID=33587 RepID=A0AAN7NR93_MYCAM|nr:hypothetical protein QYF61_002018 [Mycteria americana]
MARLTRLYMTDHHPLGLAIQPVFNPPHCLLIQPILHQLLYEDLMGDTVESLTEVQVDNIHCSPLIYQASHFIIEGYQSVPQFSKLGIIYRRCSEFLDPCGSSLYHHICSEVYQCSVLRPDLYNILINDVEEVMDLSSLQMTPDWGHQSIHSARDARQIDLDTLEEWADRNFMKFDQDKCKALCLGRKKPFAVIQAGYCQGGESSVERTRRTW